MTPRPRSIARDKQNIAALAPDFGRNAAVLPNGNWRIQALFGFSNPRQAAMARELAAFAIQRQVKLRQRAAAFLREFAHWVETALVIAPNTRSQRTLRQIRKAARSFALPISDADHKLKQALFGSRTAAFWKARNPTAAPSRYSGTRNNNSASDRRT